MIGFSISGISDTIKYIKSTIDKIVAQAVESALRAEIRQTFSAANKRIARLNNSDLASPALQALKINNIDKFSMRKIKFNSQADVLKSLQYLRDANDFVNNKTSSISGAKEYINGISKDLQNRFNIKSSKGVRNRNQEYFDIANQLLKKSIGMDLSNRSDVVARILQYNDYVKETIDKLSSDFDNRTVSEIITNIDSIDFSSNRYNNFDLW